MLGTQLTKDSKASAIFCVIFVIHFSEEAGFMQHTKIFYLPFFLQNP